MGARELGLGAVLVAVWLVATACGGSGGVTGNAGAVNGAGGVTTGGGAPTGGAGPSKVWGPVQEVTVEKRLAALHGVSDRWAQLSKLADVTGRRKQMADYIGAQPEFEASGVDTNSVWGRFKDQILLAIVDVPPVHVTPHTQASNAPVPDGSAPQSAPRPTLAFGVTEPLMAPQLGRHGQVPDGGTAAILDAFTADIPSASATDERLRSMLIAAGYTVFHPPTVTVQGLQAAGGPDLGILYINTHGGTAYQRNPVPGEPGIQVNALMTNEPLPFAANDPGQEIAYRHTCSATPPPAECPHEAMLASGELVYMLADNSWYYAVSSIFFKNRMKLSKHALVWLAVCDSMRSDATAMSLALGRLGADLVVGWTDAVLPAAGWGSALVGFDLMLGTNAYPYNVPPFRGGVAESISDFPEKPAARPFQWSTVYDALHAKGLDRSLETDVMFQLHPQAPIFAALSFNGPGMVLAPGITYIDVMQTDPDTIQIHGEFGDDPGTSNRDVYLSQDATPPPAPTTSSPPDVSSFGTKITPACTWQSTKVTCQLQGDLADKAGWVRVVARKHPSNPVPITMWKPTMTWKNSVTTQQVDLKPIFRADIHRYRENAIDPPKSRTAAFAIAPSYASSSCHINGLVQVMKNGKGIQAVLDATYDNASATKNIVLQPEFPPPGSPMKMSPTTKVGSCNAGGWFDPSTGTWTFDFGALFRAATTMDNASPNTRQSPGASAQDAAQARQTVQGLAGAGGLGPSTPVAPANGPSPPKDAPTQNWHDPLMLDLTQFDGDNKGFMGTGPPPLKIDPATPADRERQGKANFKIDDWQRLLTNRPNTTLTISAGGFDGKYAPDDKTAR